MTTPTFIVPFMPTDTGFSTVQLPEIAGGIGVRLGVGAGGGGVAAPSAHDALTLPPSATLLYSTFTVWKPKESAMMPSISGGILSYPVVNDEGVVDIDADTVVRSTAEGLVAGGWEIP